ncbi:FtsX-like permease family protein [Eubacterium sp. 1001713B170207_170306_E7]|uniref:FtsX-like permease family protein n=1 Tax=Eubacterium sp. 1001713B170207_170306_E7 TaxID=2787097 RepID=UPI00189768E6|nr:FtsX-like permease family protein [Eubacterium sp. 1001713B170207_170306_E7]
MKSYLDLIPQYARAHRKKNRITVLCITIAVCLVTAIFGMADMAIRAEVDRAIREVGNFHVILKDLDAAAGQMISLRPDVAVSGQLTAAASTALDGKELLLQGSSEALAQEMGLTVNEGSFPMQPGEALIDRQALEQLGLSIGDTITTEAVGGPPVTFTISGVFNDFSALKSKDRHAAFFNEAGIQALSGRDTQSACYVQFKSPLDIRPGIADIQATYGLSPDQIQENQRLLGLYGVSGDPYAYSLYGIALVLFLLVLTAGTIMISSSFNISVLERTRFFGLLRCLGASKKQVRRYVRRESLGFSLRGIPLGLLAGTVIIWICCAVVGHFNPTFYGGLPLFQLSPIGLAAGVVVGFLTVFLAAMSPCKKASGVSPLNAVTGNLESSRPRVHRAARTSRLPVELAMGASHAFGNRKNMALMAASFAISIILFLSFTVFIDFMSHAMRPLKPSTPDITVALEQEGLYLPDELVAQLAAVPGVERVFGRKYAPLPQEGGPDLSLISYEDQQLDWAGATLVDGSLDTIREKPDTVLVSYDNGQGWTTGDTITLALPGGSRTVTVGGVLSSLPFNAGDSGEILISSEAAFDHLVGRQGYTVIDLQVGDAAGSSTIDAVNALVQSAEKTHSGTPGYDIAVADSRQSNQEARSAFYTMSTFVYGFLFIIALITVFNIINSMNISVSSRMGQYGVMRAVGMSGRQLVRMVASESAAYALAGCAAGTVLGLPLHAFLYGQMITARWGDAWALPWLPLAIIIGLALATTLLSIIGPTQKIRRMDIVDVVNAE